MTTQNDGAGEDLDFGFDDDVLDLNFGDVSEPGDEPADLNESDMAAGTETDLSGTPAKAPVSAPPADGAKPGGQEQTPSAASPPSPGAAPVQPPSGQQPPVVDPNAAAPQQPVDGEQPSAQAPQQPVDIEAFVAENQEAIIANLATKQFSIPAQEAEDLGFSPEVKAWIERRDARNYVLAMVQTNKALQQTLPTVVANLVQVAQQVKEADTSFFGEFPELRTADKGHLKELAVTLRRMNPTMEKPKFVELLGNTACNLLGITRQPKQQQPSGQPGSGMRRRSAARPFTPAAAAAPQRNLGNGEVPQPQGLEAINMMLMSGD